MIRHTSVVRWLDAKGEARQAEFSDWSHQEALTRAWKFVKRMRTHGEALCFTILHRTLFLES